MNLTELKKKIIEGNLNYKQCGNSIGHEVIMLASRFAHTESSGIFDLCWTCSTGTCSSGCSESCSTGCTAYGVTVE